MEHVLSSEFDVAEASAGGRMTGYAIRQVNLARVKLEDKILDDITFTRVGLSGGRLAGTTGTGLQFNETSLRSADLSRAHLRNASFLNCEAIEIRCQGALLEDTRFFDSIMSNADFRYCRLLKSRFQSAELYGADFRNSFLSHCTFSDPKMGNASLTRADFRKAMLIDVDLQGANLHAANFEGAVFVRVDIRGANLVRADLRGAAMVGCTMNPGDLDGALTDES